MGGGGPSLLTSAGLRAGKYSTTGPGARAPPRSLRRAGKTAGQARSVHVTTRSGPASHLQQSAPLALPGRGGVWSGAGGPRRLEGFPIPPAEAARVCSISLVVCAYPSNATVRASSVASVAEGVRTAGAAPGQATPASSFTTATSITRTTRPTGTRPAPSPTPACVGHCPSALDSQEER